jgi:hypothetical protein
VSAGLDLLLNFARRQEVERAERLVDEVAELLRRGGLISRVAPYELVCRDALMRVVIEEGPA